MLCVLLHSTLVLPLALVVVDWTVRLQVVPIVDVLLVGFEGRIPVDVFTDFLIKFVLQLAH